VRRETHNDHRRQARPFFERLAPVGGFFGIDSLLKVIYGFVDLFNRSLCEVDVVWVLWRLARKMNNALKPR
jgi:hypothetical protein